MPRSLLLAALATLAGALAPAAAQTCTTTWQPEGAVWTSGDWTDEDRWDNGVPTASDVACVFGEGSRGFTVTLDAPREVGGLLFGSTTASIALRLNAELTVTGDGRLFGRDRIDGDLTLGGTFALDPGDLVRGGGTVTVLETGALVVRNQDGTNGGGYSAIGDGSAAGSPSELRVFGTFEAYESLSVRSAVAFDGATVRVFDDPDTGANLSSDFVTFYNGGSIQGLTLDVDAETRLTFRGAYTASGVIGGTADGVVDLSRFSTLEVAASGVEFAAGGDLGFALSNTDSGSSSELTVTTTGGEILNSGLLRLPRRPTFDGVTVRSTGTLRVDGAGGADLANGSRLVIEESGTLLFTDAISQGNRYIYGNSFSDPGEARVTLRGRIVEEGNGVSDGIFVPVDVEGGRLEAPSGVLRIGGGGRLQDVVVDIAEAGSVSFAAPNNDTPATYTFAGSFTGTASGRLGFDAPLRDTVFVVADGPVVLDVGGSGIVNERRVLMVAAVGGGAFTHRGRLVSSVGYEVRGVSFRNEGLWEMRRTTLSEDARLTNAASGKVDMVSGFTSGDGTGLMVNEGLIRAAGSSATTFRGQVEGRVGAEIRMPDNLASGAELVLYESDSLAIAPGSYLTGSGRSYADISRDIVTRGIISPGGIEPAAADSIEMRAFRMGETAELVIDVDAEGNADQIGTDFDALVDGTLRVRFAPGYQPQPGQTWDIINSFRPSAVTGTFDEVVVTGLPDGLSVGLDFGQVGNVNMRLGTPVAVSAETASLAEGERGAFVLTHPASAEPFRVAVEVGGTATPFEDFAIGANGTLGAGVGFVRIAPGTTETRVPLAAIVDGDAAEGAETVTLRVLAGSGGGGVPVEGADLATVTLGDGAAAPGVAIAAVTPSQIPATGQATITVSGSGFEDGATVTLTGPATLTAEAATVLSNGAQIRARFVTSGAPEGSYAVSVASGGETASLPGAVSVTNEVEGGTTDVWVETERRTIRDGFRNDITVRLGNDGTADAVLVPVRIAVPSALSPQIETPTADSFDLPGFDRPEWYDEEIPLWTTVEYGPPSTCNAGGPVPGGFGVTCLPPRPPVDYDVAVLFAPVIPAGGQVTLTFSVVPPGRFEIDEPYRIDVGAPFNTLDFDFEDDAEDLANAAFGAAPGPRPVNLAGCDALLGGGDDGPSDSARRLAACNNCILGMMDIANAVIGGCAGAVYSAVNALGQVANDFTTGTNGDGTWISAGTGLSSLAQAALECGLVPGLGQARAAVQLAAFGISALTTGVGIGATIGACYSCITGNTSFNAFDIISSRDPNDKLGPVGIAGADDGSYLFSLDRAGYTVRFENLETATASAVEVTITDSLDTSVYDLSRFSLGTVVLPDTSFTPPPGLAQWTTFWDRRPAVNSRVRISGELDRETGVVAWLISDLDPDTNRLRVSADAGFLPPEAGNGEGQGSVAFQVGVQPDLPDGTVIANEADIVFDRNENIRTPVYANTLDQVAPTSRATRVEPFDSDSSYVVFFEGEDAGSGVSTYDLYARASGEGAFEYVTSTIRADSVVFRGEPGVLYGFFAIAEDWVGNAEPPKTAAEVTTGGSVSAEAPAVGPESLELAAPYPNPTRGPAVLQVGMPAPGRARVTVYDVQGREVAVAHDGDLPTGWHPIPWDAGGLAAGVYVVRVEAAGSAETRSITVVR